MAVSRVCVVVLMSFLCAPGAALAQRLDGADRQRGAGAIPGNVDAQQFAGDVLALLHVSDTFRAQCARIAAEPRIHVRLTLASSVADNGRAQTTFRRYRTGAIVADVDLLFGENYRELLGHEFEHVIEQLDGVDLRHEAAEGRAWEVASGVFETRRAFTAGIRVVREADAMHARPAAVAPLR